jgi:hypothetical protein
MEIPETRSAETSDGEHELKFVPDRWRLYRVIS